MRVTRACNYFEAEKDVNIKKVNITVGSVGLRLEEWTPQQSAHLECFPIIFNGTRQNRLTFLFESSFNYVN